MTKLKLGAIEDDKPVKLTIELPAAVHRNLTPMPTRSGERPGNQDPIQSRSRR
jgi:hypothetical protein